MSLESTSSPGLVSLLVLWDRDGDPGIFVEDENLRGGDTRVKETRRPTKTPRTVNGSSFYVLPSDVPTPLPLQVGSVGVVLPHTPACGWF